MLSRLTCRIGARSHHNKRNHYQQKKRVKTTRTHFVAPSLQTQTTRASFWCPLLLTSASLGLYFYVNSQMASAESDAFELPPLPYNKRALEPAISEETLNYHYGKHHAGYVRKLNALADGTPLAKKTLEQIIKTETGKAYNLAAQIYNHTFYWNSMSPNGGGAPRGNIKQCIERSFGSFENFKAQFTTAAGTHFGSGWAWLVRDGDNNLKIIARSDAGNPLSEGLVPVLTLDVWEHAYYIDYR
mmetsp:Transcript_13086/g.14496  ORF Transcript_13086/g.14496 Transcript_13086/m.14496 type:complete len:243 (-) Transcript_13086:246-974(-)